MLIQSKFDLQYLDNKHIIASANLELLAENECKLSKIERNKEIEREKRDGMKNE